MELQTEWVEANGLRFEVLTCGAGPRLALCLHGFPEIALSWREQMFALARAGWRVWAPNQRGYGRTTRPEGVEAYAIEHLMADVAALIDASGAEEVALLGHDWGGIVAWCFAARRIRPLAKLAILNVPHPVCFLRAVRGRPGQMLRSWYVLLFQIPGLSEFLLSRAGAAPVGHILLRTSTRPGEFPRDLVEATRANAAQPGALRAMLHWYRAFLRGGGLRRQLRLGFPVIEVPTLLLWGEKDVALAKYTTEGTGAFVRDLRMEFLSGVSHWVQQDAPEASSRLLVEFLGPAAMEA